VAYGHDGLGTAWWAVAICDTFRQRPAAPGACPVIGRWCLFWAEISFALSSLSGRVGIVDTPAVAAEAGKIGAEHLISKPLSDKGGSKGHRITNQRPAPPALAVQALARALCLDCARASPPSRARSPRFRPLAMQGYVTASASAVARCRSPAGTSADRFGRVRLHGV
jgi:hypothetical protein